MIAASASGLSMTRWEPNVRCRSSVTRKTPPSTPTSSPRTSTSASRSISWKSAWLSALTMFTLAMASASRQPLAAHRRGSGLVRGCLVRTRRYRVLTSRRLVALGSEIGRQLGVHVVEHCQRVRGRRRLEAADRLGDLVVVPLLEPLLEKVPLLQIRAEAGQRVLLLPHRDFRVAPVLGRVVGGSVYAQAIRHALDQGRTVAGARPLDRLARRGVDREDVVAVHLDAGQPVRQRLLRDRARVRLLLERDGDRPLVVLAHEDDGDAPHAGEVQRLVEVALGGRPVADAGASPCARPAGGRAASRDRATSDLCRRAWARARCRGCLRCRGSTGIRPGSVVRGRFWAWRPKTHSNPRDPERYFFAAEARLGGAAGAAACSDRLAFARGRFSPEATRLARPSLG